MEGFRTLSRRFLCVLVVKKFDDQHKNE
jgi:hypothetical protein